jgi:hypothetical protein
MIQKLKLVIVKQFCGIILFLNKGLGKYISRTFIDKTIGNCYT